jgi:D-alanyl-D-alanine dipeptidase
MHHDDVPLTAPAVTAIPCADQGESLVDLRRVAALRVDDRMAGSHSAYAFVRASVADRLVIAQSLLPRGLRLLVIEGYRPGDHQDRHLHGYLDELRSANPEWTEDEVRVEAGRFCAPAETAPHPTGAAVDLTLCTLAGTEVEMGSRVHAGPAHSGGTCLTGADGIDPEARRHRTILGEAMRGAGLVNLPTAWWHWSYGDRYWCLSAGASRTPYGPVVFPVPHWDVT